MGCKFSETDLTETERECILWHRAGDILDCLGVIRAYFESRREGEAETSDIANSDCFACRKKTLSNDEIVLCIFSKHVLLPLITSRL